MTRKELVRLVTERTGMSLAAADAAVKASLEALTQALARGDAVRLPGFGTFETKHRPARTGAPVAVPASRAVRFRAGTALCDAVRRVSA